MQRNFFVGLLLTLCMLSAEAQVQIFPTRLTLTEQNISGYLNLQNSSADKQTFDLQLVLYKMRKDGGFERQKNIPASHPLVERLKFSPRQVTLNPSEKQIVRVMVSEFSELPNGEHYLHLQALPQKVTSEKNQSQNSFQLNARISVAVPIVVRKGTVQAQPQILEAHYKKLPDGTLQFNFMIQKKGDGLLVGDFEVIKKNGESEETLAIVKGVASYIDQRTFTATVPSEEVEKVSSVKDGQLIYRFRSNADSAQSFSLEGSIDQNRAIKKQISTKKPAKNLEPNRSRQD